MERTTSLVVTYQHALINTKTPPPRAPNRAAINPTPSPSAETILRPASDGATTDAPAQHNEHNAHNAEDPSKLPRARIAPTSNACVGTVTYNKCFIVPGAISSDLPVDSAKYVALNAYKMLSATTALSSFFSDVIVRFNPSASANVLAVMTSDIAEHRMTCAPSAVGVPACILAEF